MSNGILSALVCRFLPDGALDLEFATVDNSLSTGCRLIGSDPAQLTAAIVQADGRIVLAGVVAQGNVTHGLVARLDVDGNFDDSFGDGGTHVLLPASQHNTVLTDIVQAPDGQLVAVGVASVSGNNGWQVFRLRGDDGGLDHTFDGDGLKPVNFDLVAGGSDIPKGVHVLPNGGILVGGTAEGAADSACPAIVRLKADGQFDNALAGTGQYTDTFCSNDYEINDMLVQSDGRIVLAGGLSDDFVALRITPGGERDPSFGFNGLSTLELGPVHEVPVAADTALRIASQNGRLLLAGYTDPNDAGAQDFAIVRLDNDLIFADGLE